MQRRWLSVILALVVAAAACAALPAPRAWAATVTWDGGAATSNWDDAANWSGDVAPDTSDDVILDNSLAGGSYTVNLPAVAVSIRRLTITPDAGNTITLVLPSANTVNPGLSVGDGFTGTDDIILNSGAVLQNSSGTSAGTGLAVNSASNGTLRINNGGRYLHQMLRANADLVKRLSTASGTELGVFEFDVPDTGSYQIAASGYNYGSLKLTRTAGSATYTAIGSSPLTVRGDFTISSGVTFNSTMTGAMKVAGNWTNAGTFSPNGQAVEFDGSSEQSINGATTFDDLTINNAAGVSLGAGQRVNGQLALTSGRLTLGSNDLTLASDATIGGTPGASNMIVADDTGVLLKETSGGSLSSFTFPVGDSAGNYTPVALTCPTLSSGASVDVRLTAAKHPQMSGATYLLRYWTMQSTAAAVDCTGIFSYVDADVVGTEADLLPIKHSSGWTLLTSGAVDTGANTLTGSFTSFSDFTGGTASTLAVMLASFDASVRDGAVELSWDTASEIGNQGFNLYRDTSRAGPGIKLNSTLIPSQSPDSPSGFTYSYTDAAGLIAGTTYFYWLEEVGLDGAVTRHAPVTVTYEGPTAVSLASFSAAVLPTALPMAGGALAVIGLAAASLVRRRQGQ